MHESRRKFLEKMGPRNQLKLHQAMTVCCDKDQMKDIGNCP